MGGREDGRMEVRVEVRVEVRPGAREESEGVSGKESEPPSGAP